MLKYIVSLIAILLAITANAEPVTAESFLVTDLEGNVISQKYPNRTQSIASITKLMTAIVVLDKHQDLDEEILLNWKNARKYHTQLPRNMQSLTRRELLELAIVKSDNFAAYTLCENYPEGVTACVADMNQTADNLKMYNSRFTDPTGLEETNVSTAKDLIKLVMQADNYPELQAATKPEVSIKFKKKWWEFKNTNPLVGKSKANVIISKTGYIRRSGGCIVMEIETNYGTRIIALLGSKNTRTRIPEAEQIVLKVSGHDIAVE